MGKAEFYDRFLFILITATTAFLVSGIAFTKKNEKIKEPIGNSIHETNKYHSMNIHYFNYPEDGPYFLWKNMEIEENATKLSDDQFVDGKVLIDLPLGFQLFDLNVNRVAVTKEGTIQSVDPSVNWTIAPLNAEHGMTRCNISYFFLGNILYVQWDNFRFNHVYFKEREFSFQVRLGERGEIDFIYKEVPFKLTDVRDYCYCLKDKPGITFLHQELFKVPPYNETYELGYSMDFKAYEVKNGTVVRFSPADWCMWRKNCFDCTTTGYYVTPNQTARCWWCPAIEKCSSTRDILRHVWEENGCDYHHLDSPVFCKFDILGNQRFLFGLFITNLAILACIVFKDKIVGIVCCIIPSRWNRERNQPTNQPNQQVDNNQAEDQNYDEEEQEGQEEQEIEPARNQISEDIPMASAYHPDIHWVPGNPLEIHSDDEDHINRISKLGTWV